jgi:hypothetical protein
MQDDESIYELVAKELATQPRQGLLIKCMTRAGGEENKGKALYIETRVNEIKDKIRQEAKEEDEKRRQEAEALKRSQQKPITGDEIPQAPIWLIAVVFLIVAVPCLMALVFN